ncbi:hypothetical protein [Kitasatospora sp. NPDC085879]|uniref:hypothetical protein n=1 Tax=Kitasatospora sp. NPDC085879 TaxID=3154769 RepID=UPI0034392219
MNQTTPGHDNSSGGVAEAAARRVRTATAPGGWLDRRRRELAAAVDDFSTAERWVRATAYTLALATAALVLGTAGGILLQAAATVIGAAHLPEHIPGTGDGLAATITRPVHTYLTGRTPAPLTETTAYGTWKTTGLIVGFFSFASRAATWRLAWTAWSAATLAMVWNGTDPNARSVAVGITATALTAASALALRGIQLTLRPLVINRTDVQPHITVHTPEPKPAPEPARLASLPNPAGPFDHRR